ncbi:MAG TPA: S8 family serine peptidase [Syntrophales bacterium]|nr:S8 family serine peptidase [Syntrophales bacterium]HQN77021.1 S8 family serine peptidase [Syntrophales bacterium]HQQ26368.1 S8 family serine peptidase [Syntrophales bacterium]
MIRTHRKGILPFLLPVLFLWGLCPPFHAPTFAASPGEEAAAPGKDSGVGHPKLSRSLNRLIESGKPEQERTAWRTPAGTDLRLEDGRVWTVVVAGENGGGDDPGAETAELTGEIEARGGRVELVYKNLIQAWIPVESLESMADLEGIRIIRAPLRPRAIGEAPPGKSDTPRGAPVPDKSPAAADPVNEPSDSGTVVSEGRSLIGADVWQDAGYSGRGVKVAVVDVGFKNYLSLLGSELPSSVTTKFYGSSSDISGTVHGAACAELVHDIAPNASLYFTQPRTEVELGNAVTWCIAQGVRVISHSVGWSIDGGGLDGTGVIDEVVDTAAANGILWVNSAGNQALAHWGGLFSDPDGDGWLNFQGNTEINGFTLYGTDDVYVAMNWNDTWGASENDYDLFIYRVGDLTSPVASSMDIQNGNDNPAEFIAFTPTRGVLYGFRIRKVDGAAKTLQVNFLTQNELEYSVAATSLDLPADSANAVTVGAVPWNNPGTIEVFSSQGPTVDGRIKPDLVGPDYVSTASYGSGDFGGTSAACPHVAGAAALVMEAYPSWTLTEVRNLLDSRAIDQGVSGKDNVFGSGLVHLGEPAASVSYSYSRFIPYYSGLANQWTGVALWNPSTTAAVNVRILVYGASGNLLLEREETIPKKGQISQVLGTGTLREGWIRIEANGLVSGISFVGNSNLSAVMFDVPVTRLSSEKLRIPHAAQDDVWDTTLFICNPNDGPATVTLTYVNGQGTATATKIYSSIPAKGSLVYPAATLLGTAEATDGSIEILSSKPVAAAALFDNEKSGGSGRSCVGAVDPSNP